MIREIVQCFCQSIHGGEENGHWKEYANKLMARKKLDEDENLILTWLNECYANIIA